jgi:heterodisulfide reductase subunit C
MAYTAGTQLHIPLVACNRAPHTAECSKDLLTFAVYDVIPCYALAAVAHRSDNLQSHTHIHEHVCTTGTVIGAQQPKGGHVPVIIGGGVSPAPGVTVTTGGTLTSPENPSMLALQEVVQEHIKRVGLDVVKDLQQQNSKAAAEGEEPAAAAAIKAAAADAAAAAASAGAGGAAAAAASAQGISSDEVVLSVSAC